MASVQKREQLDERPRDSDSHSIGRATQPRHRLGIDLAERLGTSSPKMMVRKVMVSTTIAVAVISAARVAGCANVSCSQRANGAENAASPTMPFSMPIEVMPICTTDRNLVGLSCRSIAACAPDSPASSITCSRALRLAVSAISDMANSAFRRIRNSSRATSMRRAANGRARCNRREPPA